MISRNIESVVRTRLATIVLAVVLLGWRRDFIRSYLERDVPMFVPRMPKAEASIRGDPGVLDDLGPLGGFGRDEGVAGLR